MSAQTSIEWTDRTWNPVRGCSVVSAGCKNCYAMHVAARFNGPGMAYEGLALRSPARWTGAVRLIDKDLEAPSHWRKPQRIFVNSMSDLFHEGLTFEQIADVFCVMAYPECGRHTFQILTKRPQRMLDFFAWAKEQPSVAPWPDGGVVLPNVWLGVSVEDQRSADERIPLLLQIPAVVRFVSYEPALWPVVFAPWLGALHDDGTCPKSDPGCDGPEGGCHDACETPHGIDWVIVGGESGPGARPCNLAWIRDVVAQCRTAGVPCFVKQLGRGASLHTALGRGFHHHDEYGVTLLCKDPKGGDMAEWPEDLRVREFPEVARA